MCLKIIFYYILKGDLGAYAPITIYSILYTNLATKFRFLTFDLYILHYIFDTIYSILVILYAKRCTLHALVFSFLYYIPYTKYYILINWLEPISKEEPLKQSPEKPERLRFHRNNSPWVHLIKLRWIS